MTDLLKGKWLQDCLTLHAVVLGCPDCWPIFDILVNHPIPSHSSFLIIICKALLAGK